MKIKHSSLKKQRENAELELIIEEFSRAMCDAFRPYIAGYVQRCSHVGEFAFTPNMLKAYRKYVYFCKDHEDA